MLYSMPLETAASVLFYNFLLLKLKYSLHNIPSLFHAFDTKSSNFKFTFVERAPIYTVADSNVVGG